jgi:hypothetical protein
MNTRRLLVTIGLVAVSTIGVGCAGSKPVAKVPQDEEASPIQRHDSAGRLQSAPAAATPSIVASESSISQAPSGRIAGGQAEHDRGTTSRGREMPAAAARSVVPSRSAVGAQPQPATSLPPAAAIGSERGAIVQAPAQTASDRATVRSATNAKGPFSPAAGVPPPEAGPRAPVVGEKAAAPSVDAGWGPAPTKIGKLGVVKPTTRPIDVDPTLVDAITLPNGDPRREIIGIWEQVGGGNDPDFAHGDYSKSILTFRNDGVLDVARFYGPRGEVRVNRQLAFHIEDSKLVLATTQGADAIATDLPLAAGPNGTTIVARKPKSALPTKFGYSAKPESITVEGRTYKRVQPVVTPNPK